MALYEVIFYQDKDGNAPISLYKENAKDATTRNREGETRARGI
jgi:hypothetical protein